MTSANHSRRIGLERGEAQWAGWESNLMRPTRQDAQQTTHTAQPRQFVGKTDPQRAPRSLVDAFEAG